MLKYVNLPSLLLITFVLRCLALGASIGEAIVIISLSALYSYYTFLESKKEIPVNKEIKEKLTQLEESIKLTKDKVNSLTFGSQIKK